MKMLFLMQTMLIFFCIGIYEKSAYAFSSYYVKNPVGWHWNDVNDEKVSGLKKKALPKKTQQAIQENNPIAQMKMVHEELAYYKDRAVLNPTVENIRGYLVMQNMIMNRSTLFAQNWKKTMLLYPEFDYGVAHPTDSAVSQINQSSLHNQKVKIAKSLAKQYGLIFFYDGSNPLSFEMENTVAQFSRFYGFSTIAVSMDQKIIPNLLPTRPDSGQAKALGVKALPALVLVNPKTGSHVVLTYGYTSIEDLLTDCYTAVTQS